MVVAIFVSAVPMSSMWKVAKYVLSESRTSEADDRARVF